MIYAERLRKNWPQAKFDNDDMWYLSSMLLGPFSWRLCDAWKVLCGRATAIEFEYDRRKRKERSK